MSDTGFDSGDQKLNSTESWSGRSHSSHTETWYEAEADPGPHT